MCSQSSVHGCAHHAEVVLFIVHELSQGLLSCLLLAGLGVDEVDFLLRHLDWFARLLVNLHRVCAIFLFSEAEVNEVNHVGLLGIEANDNVGWLQVPVDVSLGVQALQTVHQLQSDDDNGLNGELALFE